MNLFEKIEMFEKLASTLTDDTIVSEVVETIDFSNENSLNSKAHRSATLLRMKKLSALTIKF